MKEITFFNHVYVLFFKFEDPTVAPQRAAKRFCKGLWAQNEKGPWHKMRKDPDLFLKDRTSPGLV